MKRLLILCLLIPVLSFADDAKKAPKLDIPKAKYPMKEVVSGGQPSARQFEEAKKKGYKTVINLRSKQEEKAYAFEAGLLKKLGMDYVHIPVKGAAGITKENMKALFKALKEAKKPVLLHCASGNRVGALVALKAAYVDGKKPEEAIKIGKEAGMTKLEAVVKKILAD